MNRVRIWDKCKGALTIIEFNVISEKTDSSGKKKKKWEMSKFIWRDEKIANVFKAYDSQEIRDQKTGDSIAN